MKTRATFVVSMIVINAMIALPARADVLGIGSKTQDIVGSVGNVVKSGASAVGDFFTGNDAACVNSLKDSEPRVSRAKKSGNDCVITKCNDGYQPDQTGNKCECPTSGGRYKQEGDKCIDNNGKDCYDTFSTKPAHSKGAKYSWDNDKLVCVLKCENDYKASSDNKTCVQSSGECAPDIDGARFGKMKDGKCVATECIHGYALKDDTCLKLDDQDVERIDKLQENADAVRKNEQSTANKLLGTAATALTGQGLSMALSGGATAAADKATEQEMKAYLETFRCSYGSGTYKGGETDIELPGATALGSLKTEYVTLAAELKEMKTALGLKPGIESEEILDSATIGLHDDERHGIETGAFTSVSRALLNKDGEDAAAWAQQKADAEKKAKTGAIMAGAGVVGGIVGNALINKDSKEGVKDKSKEINQEYDKKRKDIRNNLKETTNKSKQLNEEKPRVEPDNIELTAQERCKNQCGTYNNGKCDANPDVSACQQQLGKKYNFATCSCEDVPGVKITGSDGSNILSVLGQGTSSGTGGGTQKTALENQEIGSLYNATLFDKSGYTVSDPNDHLNKVAKEITDKIGSSNDFKLYVVGHTDMTRVNPNGNLCKKADICDNEALAKRRAKEVGDYLEKKNDKLRGHIETIGNGDRCAIENNTTNHNDARRVDFFLLGPGEELDRNRLCSLESWYNERNTGKNTPPQPDSEVEPDAVAVPSSEEDCTAQGKYYNPGGDGIEPSCEDQPVNLLTSEQLRGVLLGGGK